MGIKSASDFDGATEGRAQEVPPVAPSLSDNPKPYRAQSFTLECGTHPGNIPLLEKWQEGKARLVLVVEYEELTADGNNVLRRETVWAHGSVSAIGPKP
jgi:hypothetical protein